jgi:hypothetical protein
VTPDHPADAPAQPWGDVVRVLNRTTEDSRTVEQLRRMVRRLFQGHCRGSLDRPQPLQLVRDVRLRLPSRCHGLAIPAPAISADQRRQPAPKISRDLAPGPPTRQSQPDRLVLKFLRKPSQCIIELLTPDVRDKPKA